jgi:hypothetical protein
MSMKKLCLALLFLGASLNAETIFHKKDGTEITPDEHKVLYNILIKYQFPASTMFGVYVADELKAMNDAIKKELPDSGIEATFMPTTLYQLFAIYFISQNLYNLDQASSGVFKPSQNKRTPGFSIAQKITPETFATVMKDKRIIDFHRTINNYILSDLKAVHLSVPKNVDDSYAIIDKFLQFIITRYPSTTGGFFTSLFPDAQKDYRLNLIKRALEIEYKAYEADKLPIYRTSPQVDSASDAEVKEKSRYGEHFKGWWSLSFSQSLLAGSIADPSACALTLLFGAKNGTVCYAVFIDKKSYFNGPQKNLFFIPPCTALVDLLGSGEFFHARSKIPSLKEINLFCFQWLPEGPLLNPLKQIYEISGCTEKRKEVYEGIRNFIKDNHVLLTDNRPINLPKSLVKQTQTPPIEKPILKEKYPAIAPHKNLTPPPVPPRYDLIHSQIPARKDLTPPPVPPRTTKPTKHSNPPAAPLPAFPQKK